MVYVLDMCKLLPFDVSKIENQKSSIIMINAISISVNNKQL